MASSDQNSAMPSEKSQLLHSQDTGTSYASSGQSDQLCKEDTNTFNDGDSKGNTCDNQSEEKFVMARESVKQAIQIDISQTNTSVFANQTPDMSEKGNTPQQLDFQNIFQSHIAKSMISPKAPSSQDTVESVEKNIEDNSNQGDSSQNIMSTKEEISSQVIMDAKENESSQNDMEIKDDELSQKGAPVNDGEKENLTTENDVSPGVVNDDEDKENLGEKQKDCESVSNLETTETSNIGIDEESCTQDDDKDDKTQDNESDKQSGENTTPKRKPRRRRGSLSGTLQDEVADGTGLAASSIFEYQWPQEKGADYFILQEQISEYLGVLSFKRKYPDLQRRTVEILERVYLKENGVVTETQCDLGLCALKSDEILDLMQRDYPEKFKEYAQALQEKISKQRSETNKDYDMPRIEKNKMESFRTKALKSAANFNAHFMREKREERRAYFDLQTMEVHYPQGKMKKLPAEATKVGAYPVGLIPGQYQDYYKKYTPQQLKYHPLNTSLYDPPRALKNIYIDPDQMTVTDDGDTTSQATNTEGSSGSSEGDSDSGSESSNDSGSGDEEQEKKMEIGIDEDSQMSSISQKSSKNGRMKFKGPAPLCSMCAGTNEKNKLGEAEMMIQCSECQKFGHPSCLELTDEMLPVIVTYPWQCMECKTCVACMDPGYEDKMLFCDHCDRGYHTFCVGLKTLPKGRWECPSCQPGSGGKTPKALKTPKTPKESKTPKEPKAKKAKLK